MDGYWTALGKILAVLALMVTPFIVVVPDEYKPYITSVVAALQAGSIYCAHADNANTVNPAATK